MKTAKGMLEYGRFRIPYRAYGDSPDVFLCVSGILQTMAVWRAVARRFCDRYTVIVFDMPGVGRSEILSGGPHVTVEEQLEVVHALVQHTDSGGELALAGSSWGTVIAAGYAAQRPEAVQRLVLSSFGMKPNAVMEQIVEQAQVLYDTCNYAEGADLIISMFGQQLGPAYKRQIEAQFANLSSETADAFYAHCCNILKLGHLQESIDLSRIAASTLIVNGSDDQIIDLDDMWVAEALIPDCRCLLIDGVGHFLHFERPEILRYYDDFLLARSRPVRDIVQPAIKPPAAPLEPALTGTDAL